MILWNIFSIVLFTDKGQYSSQFNQKSTTLLRQTSKIEAPRNVLSLESGTSQPVWNLLLMFTSKTTPEYRKEQDREE